MLKKGYRTIVLAFFLIIICLSAYADEGLISNSFFIPDSNGNQEDYIISTAAANGNLYMLSNQLLYEYTPGTETKQVIMDWNKILGELDRGQPRDELLEEFSKTRINGLICNPNNMYAINDKYGDLYIWNENELQLCVTIDVEKSRIADSIGSKFLNNNHLYYLVPFMDAAEGDELYDYDIEKHTFQKQDVGYVYAISDYIDGNIALLRASETLEGSLEIAEYQVKKKEIQTLIVLQDRKAGGLCYSSELEKLMFLEAGTVFAIDGQGDTETIGFLPVGPSDPQWIVHVFPHNVLSLFTQQGVYVRHMSGNVSSATSLRLLLCNTDYMPSFIAAYPNVDVYTADIKEVGETELAQAFLNGTLEYDIIEIEASRLFRSLANKGYLANLLMSEKLAQNNSQFYPTIQSALTMNNMLVGIPSKMTVETWAYDDKRWNTFIPENPPPCTFDQYMALCEEWLDAALQGEVDYCLVYPSFSFFQELYVDMLDLYINQYDDNSKSFTFDTPIFRNMINRIKELQMKYSFNTSSLLACDSQQPLLNVRYNGHLKADEFSGLGEWKPMLPIVFGEDERPAINANLIVYVVNANSSNIETALCFLEHVVQNRAFADERLLKPDVNDPIERPKFMEEREALRNNIEYLHKLKETADKSELAQIEETLVFQEHLWNTGEERRWLISAEEIEEYRQIAKYLSIRQTALSAIQSSADYRILSTIIFKFADGLIDSNECIQQLNARLELMLFESD